MGDVSDLIGTVIAGKYAVDRIIGRGGMGTVLRATHTELRKPVAIKVLHVEALEDREATIRFVREARAAAHVASDHVAQVYDVGRLESGAPYMVMEFLQGHDLLAEIREYGPMTVPQATDVILQACEAVAHAHCMGVIHRDLKPANLFLVPSRDGSKNVKVLDFGISRAKEEAEGSITQSSSMLGSPQYMAPEQIRDPRLADERADIWSLGIILYELLTAAQPFLGATPSGILAAIVADPHVPLSERNPDLPHSLTSVIDRCLEKHPEDRYQDVGELARDLAPWVPASRRELALSIVTILESPPSDRPPLSPSEPALRLSDSPPRGDSPSLGAGQPSRRKPTGDSTRRDTDYRRSSALAAAGDTLKEGKTPRYFSGASPTLLSDSPLEVPLMAAPVTRFWAPLVGALALLIATGSLLLSRGRQDVQPAVSKTHGLAGDSKAEEEPRPESREAESRQEGPSDTETTSERGRPGAPPSATERHPGQVLTASQKRAETSPTQKPPTPKSASAPPVRSRQPTPPSAASARTSNTPSPSALPHGDVIATQQGPEGTPETQGDATVDPLATRH